MYYTTEAQALIVSGSDTTGNWRPWYLSPANPIYSELTGTVTALGFLLFPGVPLLAAKFVPILLGSALPVLLGLISFRLTNNKTAFLATALLATGNPWIFQFSRMGFDSLFSSSLYMLGLVLLLFLKKWKILYSLIPFTVGFYQYQGHKPLLAPLVILFILYLIIEKESWKFLPKFKVKNWLPHIAVAVFCVLLVGIHILRLPYLSSAVRIKETLILDPATAAERVNINRRLTFSNPFIPVFDNKYVTTVEAMSNRFFSSFNFYWIFQHGNDQVDTFAVTKFGFLYALDAVLIIIALVTFKTDPKYKKEALLILGIITIGTIPNILKNENLWLTFRGGFMILGMIILAGIGLFKFLQRVNVKISTLFIVLYCCNALFFFYHYFFQYPFKTTKDIFFYERVAANYIHRVPHKKIIIYTTEPTTLFNSILTYNSFIRKELIPQINTAFKTNDFTIENVVLKAGCFNTDELKNLNVVVFVDYRVVKCSDSVENTALPEYAITMQLSSLIDSGTVFTVYGDTLCKDVSLDQYSHVQSNVFNVEKLDTFTFCKSFFIR
jgi:hypothetical protein